MTNEPVGNTSPTVRCHRSSRTRDAVNIRFRFSLQMGRMVEERRRIHWMVVIHITYSGTVVTGISVETWINLISYYLLKRFQADYCAGPYSGRIILGCATLPHSLTKSRLRRRLFDLQQRQIAVAFAPSSAQPRTALSDDPPFPLRPRRQSRKRRNRRSQRQRHASSSADSQLCHACGAGINRTASCAR